MRSNLQLKDKLIQMAVVELTLNGVEQFSLRETAKKCGVSCAAPFKHFKDKADLFQCISEHLDKELLNRIYTIEIKCNGDLKALYMETSAAYIENLIAHPFLMNLSFWSRPECSHVMGIRWWKSLGRVIEHFNNYCSFLGFSDEKHDMVFFMMQNITYGLAFMGTSKMLDEKKDYSEKLRIAMESLFLY